MSIALAPRWSDAMCIQEATIMEQSPFQPGPFQPPPEAPGIEYRWSDVKARRAALALRPEDMAALLGINAHWYAKYEASDRGKATRPDIVQALIAMEAFVDDMAKALTDAAPADTPVVLRAIADDDEFAAAYPSARMPGNGIHYPVCLAHVAVGRAAAQLSRDDRAVEVYRGERRFDLAAIRMATGVGKNEAAWLLDVNKKKYYRIENGAEPLREHWLAEIQDIDDFIDMLVGELPAVPDLDGTGSTIWIADGQERFQELYPQAVVERSGRPYPVNVLWVAAGRLAGELRTRGPVRIAVSA